MKYSPSESRNKHSETKTSYYKSSARDTFSNGFKERRGHNDMGSRASRLTALIKRGKNLESR